MLNETSIIMNLNHTNFSIDYGSIYRTICIERVVDFSFFNVAIINLFMFLFLVIVDYYKDRKFIINHDIISRTIDITFMLNLCFILYGYFRM